MGNINSLQKKGNFLQSSEENLLQRAQELVGDDLGGKQLQSALLESLKGVEEICLLPDETPSTSQQQFVKVAKKMYEENNAEVNGCVQNATISNEMAAGLPLFLVLLEDAVSRGALTKVTKVARRILTRLPELAFFNCANGICAIFVRVRDILQDILSSPTVSPSDKEEAILLLLHLAVCKGSLSLTLGVWESLFDLHMTISSSALTQVKRLAQNLRPPAVADRFGVSRGLQQSQPGTFAVSPTAASAFGSVQAKQALSSTHGYFEMEILRLPKACIAAIGVLFENMHNKGNSNMGGNNVNDDLPGNCSRSAGYHSDGRIWINGSVVASVASSTVGDIIGCGVRYLEDTTIQLFVTKNMVIVWTSQSLTIAEEVLVPCVGLDGRRSKVKVCLNAEYHVACEEQHTEYTPMAIMQQIEQTAAANNGMLETASIGLAMIAQLDMLDQGFSVSKKGPGRLVANNVEATFPTFKAFHRVLARFKPTEKDPRNLYIMKVLLTLLGRNLKEATTSMDSLYPDDTDDVWMGTLDDDDDDDQDPYIEMRKCFDCLLDQLMQIITYHVDASQASIKQLNLVQAAALEALQAGSTLFFAEMEVRVTTLSTLLAESVNGEINTGQRAMLLVLLRDLSRPPSMYSLIRQRFDHRHAIDDVDHPLDYLYQCIFNFLLHHTKQCMSNYLTPSPSYPKACDVESPSGGVSPVDLMNLVTPVAASARGGARVFKYWSDFDENGLFFYLGTHEWEGADGTTWKNPGLEQVVKCEMGRSSGSASGSATWLTDRVEVGRKCWTPNAQKDGWFTVDLGEHRTLCPTHYTLRRGGGVAKINSWVFEGGCKDEHNNTVWTVLKEHENDTSLYDGGRDFGSHTWKIDNPSNKGYQLFRWRATRPATNGDWFHALCQAELYGKYYNKATAAISASSLSGMETDVGFAASGKTGSVLQSIEHGLVQECRVLLVGLHTLLIAELESIACATPSIAVHTRKLGQKVRNNIYLQLIAHCNELLKYVTPFCTNNAADVERVLRGSVVGCLLGDALCGLLRTIQATIPPVVGSSNVNNTNNSGSNNNDNNSSSSNNNNHGSSDNNNNSTNSSNNNNNININTNNTVDASPNKTNEIATTTPEGTEDPMSDFHEETWLNMVSELTQLYPMLAHVSTFFLHQQSKSLKPHPLGNAKWQGHFDPFAQDKKDTKIVESSHPYEHNTTSTQFVCIEGATYLSIEFDEKCRTNPTDVLEILDAREHYVIARFGGESCNWPKVPVLVPGDSINISFQSQNGDAAWGYLLDITGYSATDVRLVTNDMQSNHPYAAADAGDKPQSQPNAMWSQIMFVDECATLAGQDCLDIIVNDQVVKSYGGNDWPRDPLYILQGNFKFHFSVSSNQSTVRPWGWSVKVTSFIHMKTEEHWSFELAALLARVTSRICKDLILDISEHGSGDVDRWFASDLLCQGLDNSPYDPTQLIDHLRTDESVKEQLWMHTPLASRSHRHHVLETMEDLVRATMIHACNQSQQVMTCDDSALTTGLLRHVGIAAGKTRTAALFAVQQLKSQLTAQDTTEKNEQIYHAVCDLVTAKCHFLLKYKPKAVESSFHQLHHDSTSSNNNENNNVNWGNLDIESIEHIIIDRLDLVQVFLTSNVTVVDMEATAKRRMARATCVQLGLNCLDDLLTCASNNRKALLCVLQHCGDVLHGVEPPQHHLPHLIAAAPPQAQLQFHQRYKKILDSLVSVLANGEAHMLLRLAATLGLTASHDAQSLMFLYHANLPHALTQAFDEMFLDMTSSNQRIVSGVGKKAEGGESMVNFSIEAVWNLLRIVLLQLCRHHRQVAPQMTQQLLDVAHMVLSKWASLKDHGNEHVENGIQSCESFSWSRSLAFRDMQLTLEDRCCKRSNSSGWGCVLGRPQISEGKHYFEIWVQGQISDYMYLGLAYPGVDLSDNYNGKNICWRKGGGALRKHGEKEKDLDGGYKPGDRIGLAVNMDERTVDWFKNGKHIHQTTGIKGPCYPFVSLGTDKLSATLVDDAKIPDEFVGSWSNNMSPNIEYSSVAACRLLSALMMGCRLSVFASITTSATWLNLVLNLTTSSSTYIPLQALQILVSIVKGWKGLASEHGERVMMHLYDLVASSAPDCAVLMDAEAAKPIAVHSHALTTINQILQSDSAWKDIAANVSERAMNEFVNSCNENHKEYNPHVVAAVFTSICLLGGQRHAIVVGSEAVDVQSALRGVVIRCTSREIFVCASDNPHNREPIRIPWKQLGDTTHLHSTKQLGIPFNIACSQIVMKALILIIGWCRPTVHPAYHRFPLSFYALKSRAIKAVSMIISNPNIAQSFAAQGGIQMLQLAATVPWVDALTPPNKDCNNKTLEEMQMETMALCSVATRRPFAAPKSTPSTNSSSNNNNMAIALSPTAAAAEPVATTTSSPSPSPSPCTTTAASPSTSGKGTSGGGGGVQYEGTSILQDPLQRREVSELAEMGFPKLWCLRALKEKNWNKEQAVAWLLDAHIEEPPRDSSSLDKPTPKQEESSNTTQTETEQEDIPQQPNEPIQSSPEQRLMSESEKLKLTAEETAKERGIGLSCTGLEWMVVMGNLMVHMVTIRNTNHHDIHFKIHSTEDPIFMCPQHGNIAAAMAVNVYFIVPPIFQVEHIPSQITKILLDIADVNNSNVSTIALPNVFTLCGHTDIEIPSTTNWADVQEIEKEALFGCGEEEEEARHPWEQLRGMQQRLMQSEGSNLILNAAMTEAKVTLAYAQEALLRLLSSWKDNDIDPSMNCESCVCIMIVLLRLSNSSHTIPHLDLETLASMVRCNIQQNISLALPLYLGECIHHLLLALPNETTAVCNPFLAFWLFSIVKPFVSQFLSGANTEQHEKMEIQLKMMVEAALRSLAAGSISHRIAALRLITRIVRLVSGQMDVVTEASRIMLPKLQEMTTTHLRREQSCVGSDRVLYSNYTRCLVSVYGALHDLGVDMCVPNNSIQEPEVVDAGSCPVMTDFKWDKFRHFEDCELSDNDRSIHRLNCEHWGCALGSPVVGSGLAYWEWKIHGGPSDYLYAGVAYANVPMDDNYCDHNICWRKGGGVLRKHGEKERDLDNGFSSSDVIGIGVNMTNMTVSWFKNGRKIHVTEGLKHPCYPFISSGTDNLKISFVENPQLPSDFFGPPKCSMEPSPLLDDYVKLRQVLRSFECRKKLPAWFVEALPTPHHEQIASVPSVQPENTLTRVGPDICDMHVGFGNVSVYRNVDPRKSSILADSPGLCVGGVAVSDGLCMYEFRIGGLFSGFEIGWILTQRPTASTTLGDDEMSWTLKVTNSSIEMVHNALVQAVEWPSNVKSADVIGCWIDLNCHSLGFLINGVAIPRNFENLPTPSNAFFPAISLRAETYGCLNFGGRSCTNQGFWYPHGEYLSLNNDIANDPIEIPLTQETINVGDRVRIIWDPTTLQMSSEGHGGWNSAMARTVGLEGNVTEVGNKSARVTLESGLRWFYNPAALLKTVDKTRSCDKLPRCDWEADGGFDNDNWMPQADVQLIAFANERAKISEVSSICLSPENLFPASSDTSKTPPLDDPTLQTLHRSCSRLPPFVNWQQSHAENVHSDETGHETAQAMDLSRKSIGAIRARFVVLKAFNQLVVKCLPLMLFDHVSALCGSNTVMKSLSVDAVLADDAETLAVLRAKDLIFTDVKLALLNKAMELSMTSDQQNISINRGAAAHAAQLTATSGKCVKDGLRSVFGQVYTQLEKYPLSVLRRKERPWKVQLEGEGAQDAGGPYREVISDCCRDLMSNNTPLFIPTPNGRADQGFNQDLRIPNPLACTARHLSLFRFVGAVLGIAIRTSHPLGELYFPSIFWRPLANLHIDVLDLARVDRPLIQALEHYRRSSTTEAFDALELTWTTVTADGRVIELVPRGLEKHVTFDEREEYSKKTLQYRLHEFDPQMAATKEGLGQIVPIGLIQLLTAKELESIVCGHHEIDIAKLKAHTEYTSCSQESKAVKMFWEVLESFSHEDRAQFIAFVWGRTRLPQSNGDWKQRFSIRLTSTESRLPTAATCSFSLTLPEYPTIEMMRSKLLYAIHNARAIDTDFTATGIFGEEE